MNSHKIKIEQGVPLPQRIKNRFSVGRLPLSDLSPGDSFLIEIPPEHVDRALHSIRVRLNRFSLMNKGTRFSSTKDPSGNGVRVWRVE